ncbi:MAG: (Fe-S)-binding protein [Chitinophagales bacterium]
MKRISLFIPCTVDLLMSEVGRATVTLLKKAGVIPVYHPEQTCCGHPAITAGVDELAVDLAKRFIEIFEKDDYIVCPAGSCIYTVKKLYSKVLAGEPSWKERAERIGSRVYELSQFLVDVLGIEDLGAEYHGKIAYHESCSLLRQLGISAQPKRLLQNVKGVEQVPLNEADACCGFGGEFSYRFAELSAAVVGDKVKNFLDSGAEILILSDPGCLLNVSGYLRRHHPEKKAMHLAVFLANNMAEVTA